MNRIYLYQGHKFKTWAGLRNFLELTLGNGHATSNARHTARDTA